MNISEEKRQLRKGILKIRKEMDLENKIEFDNLIQKKFCESKFYIESTDIFIYISYDSEIDTKFIIEKSLTDGKRIYVPRINGKEMEAVQIKSLNKLEKNKYGILEPKNEEIASNPNKFDLIIMPGVAFDKNGGRMGYGAGYYDRYLKILKKMINKIAFAYEFQIIKKVPSENHDIPIDYIITEKQFDKCIQGK